MPLLDRESEKHFKLFVDYLYAMESKYDFSSEQLLEIQKNQVDTLVALEDEFKQSLIACEEGQEVFRKFIRFCLDEKRNVLAARVYTRERIAYFSEHISPAIKARHDKELWRFNYNYQFVAFALEHGPFGPGTKPYEIAQKIKPVRSKLIEMNLPLAINRARLFWSRTPTSHLSFMDLVQLAGEGLTSAVDKYTPPFSAVFRSVCIGRMVGLFIQSYSETMLHFYPDDRRRLYHANKNRPMPGQEYDFVGVAEKINREVGDASFKTTPEELAHLMSAAKIMSGNAKTRGFSEGKDATSEIMDLIADSSQKQPENEASEHEVNADLHRAIDGLSLIERKLLTLKGIRHGNE